MTTRRLPGHVFAKLLAISARKREKVRRELEYCDIPPSVDIDALIDDLKEAWAKHTKRYSPGWRDPLIIAASTRPYRTKSTVEAKARQATKDQARRDAEWTAIKAADKRKREIRDTLIAAARVARQMGWHVRASKSRDGLVSSYYCTAPDGFGRPALRISDHEIPATPQREYMASLHGRDFYEGYHGFEIIIRQKRSKTWLRRALTLIADGRYVPGE